MKQFLIAATIAAAAIANSTFAADVGVSVSIGQPGFYGRLDIGDFPPPQVIYRQPSVVEYVPVERPPIYLRVPPGHARHWSSHCREYNACGERVYFVRDDWYTREYAPRYREQHHEGRGEYREEYRDDHRGGERDHRRDDNRGHGRDR